MISAITAVMIAITGAACGAPSRTGAGEPAAVTSAARFVFATPAGSSPIIRAVLDDGTVEHNLTVSDLDGLDDLTAEKAAWFPTASRGTLRVRVTLWGTAGELGTDSLSLPLQAGWMWAVEALVHRPAAGIAAPPCFGCAAETHAPLRANAARGIAPGDSLFLRAMRVPAPGRAPAPPS